jgi:flagellin
VGISTSAVTTTDQSALAQAINDQSTATGITASHDSGVITLTHNQGENITIETYLNDAGTTDTTTLTAVDGNGDDNGAAITLTDAASDSAIITGTLDLSSSKLFSVAGASTTLTATTKTAALNSVDTVDLGTQSGAQDALAIIDGALAQIDNSRASLGAVQNRFGHTISNLANIEENVSASRSRIQDTDFAVETAVMTKNQILQQAGTSILAQANQIPQAAISLLGG